MVHTQPPVVKTGPSIDDPGPLTRTVLAYVETMRRIVNDASADPDWAPLTEFVAVDEFERVGTRREVQDWQEYTDLLTKWASGAGRFETTLRRVCELSDVVYYEVEERHYRGDDVNVVNSMTVFTYNEAGKIRHLDVYLQSA
jgi:hypothetical protein